MAYDIIGDIHGEAGKLTRLLAALGYAPRDGVWSHPSRQALFVGDFIDRGPEQVRTVGIVRAMVQAGSARAVMGNHEFNAIAWHTPDPAHPGEYCRAHAGEAGRKHRQQHAAFLGEVESHPALHTELVDWFRTLPLWLELPELRLVHACWSDAHMAHLAPSLTSGRQLPAETLVAASRKGRPEYRSAECLTKGPEADLPEGVTFDDKDGYVRRNVRIRWWDTQATRLPQLALMPPDLCARLPDVDVPEDMRCLYRDSKPVFFGHYWMTGTPRVLSPSAVCVDYSAAKSGPLVAYRWSGGPLSPQAFVAVA